MLLRDANSRVSDFELDDRVRRHAFDVHGTPVRRISNGIADQIIQDGTNPFCISSHGECLRGLQLKVEGLRFGNGGKGLDGVEQDVS